MYKIFFFVIFCKVTAIDMNSSKLCFNPRLEILKMLNPSLLIILNMKMLSSLNI